MSTELVKAAEVSVPAASGGPALPDLVERAGGAARFAWEEFFYAEHHNRHTQRAYERAVRRFLAWVEGQEVELVAITPGMVGQYLVGLGGSPAKRNQHLAALRGFFDRLVTRHVCILNPAASVKGVKEQVIEGKTPEITIEQARTLLRSVDTGHVVGLRDRAILATLAYTACRAGAVAKLRLGDFQDDGTQYVLRFQEKGGKSREIPVRHDLEKFRFIRIQRAPVLKKADMLIPLGVAFRAPRWEISMSTRLLYHAFGIRGYRYIRTDYRGGEVFFTIGQDLETCHCSACGAGAVRPRGRVERRFRAQPIGSRPTTIVLLVPRVECLACGVVRQVEIAFADPRRGYTRSFERHALELSRRMTIRDVASHLGVGWDVVKDIQKRDLMRRFAKPRLKDIAVMAIDEIAVAKGHRYLTLVMDLDSGAVKFVGDGKGADALQPFWKRLRPSGARIEAVAMDMSGGYQAAVRAHLADAVIVFDPFHVVKLFNDKLSDLRRALYREAIDVQHKEVLKGTRWLLLKNTEDLDPKKDEKSRLKEALKLNEPLATAYYLKEDLRRFWEQPGKRFATTFLDGWIRRAEASGIKILQQMAKTLAAHRSGLLAYYDVLISSGPLEGTNNKIKTMKRQAYGFRDPEFFKPKILAIHESSEVDP